MPDQIIPSHGVQHCIRRAWERYQLEMDATTIAHIEETVLSRRCGILAEDARMILADVCVGSVAVRVIYSKEASCLSTIIDRKQGSARITGRSVQRGSLNHWANRQQKRLRK